MKTPVLVFLILLLGTGCVPHRLRQADVERERELTAFFRYLDAETVSDRKEALQALQQEYPDNPLTDRAFKLNQLETTRLEQQTKIRKLSADLKQCQEENTRKEADNASLKKDMEQLKQLVIDMEMKAR